MSVGVAGRSRRLAVTLILLAAGCSAPEAVSLLTRPPVPEGWVEIERGGVRVAVPEEWGSEIGGQPDSIFLSALIPPLSNPGVGLMAVGPRGETQPEPPFTDERLEAWLLDWVSNRRPDFYQRDAVLLPVGRAVRVRLTFDPGTPDGVEVAVYAVPTAVGVAVLQITVDASLMDRYARAVDQIPYLFQFGFAESR